MQTAKKTARDIPCYAIYGNDNFSTEWGNKLVDLWIAAKKEFVANPVSVDVFRKSLHLSIFEAADFYDAFVDGCRDAGMKPNERLYEEYEALHLPDALQLIPSNLHAEFCYVPEWKQQDLDDLMYDLGMKSDRYKSNYMEDVQPGKWLEVFLKLVNCSSTDLVAESLQLNNHAFAEKCAAANFKVDKDQMRPSLMTAVQVISAIENGYFQAVPMVHCEINLRELFKLDPTKAMRLSTVKGKVHVGFHEFFNGAGYMDTYPGEVIVPADATGFAGENRWSYGIDKVYCIVKSCFYCTPVAIDA
jgi:hypothetical protein